MAVGCVLLAVMRAYPILVALALAIVALTGHFLAVVTMEPLVARGEGIPAGTAVIFARPVLFWVVPVGFAIYALILGVKREPSAPAYWLFTGLALLVGVFLLCAIVVATVLPLMMGY